MNGDLALHDGGGGGEGVLWLHGYTLDSQVWKELWTALPGRRHVGVDLPGHGGSRRWRRGETLASLADELHDVASACGLRQVVALSFGTLVALELAIRHPEAFTTLTLAAPALAGGPSEPGAAQRYGELARLYRARGPGSHMTALWTRPPPDIFLHARRDPVRWPHLAAIIDRHRWDELADGTMFDLTRGAAHTPTALAGVRARTLVIIGEHELPVSRWSAAILARDVSDAAVAVLPAAGHLCLLEAPERSGRVLGAHLF